MGMRVYTSMTLLVGRPVNLLIYRPIDLFCVLCLVFCVLCPVPSAYSAETAGIEKTGNEDHIGLIDPWTHRPIDLFVRHPSLKWLGLPVVSIQCKCDGVFSEDEIRSAMVARVGDLYSRSQIRESIRKIYSLGGLSNVEVDAQLSRRSNGVMLTFILTKQAKTRNIYLTGNEKVKREEIVQVMRLEKGRGYDDSIAEMDAQSIRELYKSRGYFNAGISFQPNTDHSSNQADIYFRITEGGQPLVREIVFIGTNQAVIRTKTLFRIGLQFQSDLDNKRISQRLLREFENKGNSLSDKAAVSVGKTGERWLITDVQKVYSIRKENDRLNIYRTKGLLEEMGRIRLGDAYKGEQALDSDAKLIEKMHREEGYITARIKNAQALSEPGAIEEYRGKGTHLAAENSRIPAAINGEVVIVIEIEQGRRVYIKIEGDRDIKDDAIKKAIAVRRMHSVSESVLRKSDEDIENLYKLKGYYLADVKHRVLKDEVWNFDTDGDAEGWELVGEGSSLSPIMSLHVSDRALKISSQPISSSAHKPTNMLQSPKVEIDTDIYQKVHIRMRTSKGSVGRLYWTDKPSKWDRKKYQNFDVVSDSRFRDYEIDLRNHKRWSNKVIQFRLRPVDLPGADIDIESIKVTTESIPVIFTVDKKRLMKVKNVSIKATGGAELEVPEEEIKKQMLTREKNPLSFWPLSRYLPRGVFYEPVFEMDLRAIIAFYRDKGYPNARIVDHKIKPEEEEGRIDITITIYEGPRAVVTEVILEGNHKDILATKEILSNLAVIPRFHKQNLILFSLTLEFQSDLDSNRISENLRQAFKDNDISLSKNATVSTKEKSSEWLITDENKKYAVREEENRLNIYQNLIIESLDPPRARYMVVPHAGEPPVFRDDDVVADRSYLRARYADEGYLAQIEPVKQFNDDKTEVAITYRIVEGKQIRIHDKIDIKVRPPGESTGNPRTKRYVIERELSDRLTEDKIFSYTEIAKSWQNLLDLGLFERVRIDTEPIDGSEDLYKMVIHVTEKKAISVNMHAGFSSSQDFRGGIGATHINLWGTGRRASGKYQIGTEGSSYEFNYAEPRLLGTRALGLADVYRYSERDYNETRTGGTVGISQRLYRINTLTYRYRYDFVEYEIDEDEREARIGSIETTFERDGRDDPLDPKRGWFHGLTLEYANPLLRGEETFAKLTVNSIRYSRLPRNSVLAIGGRAGYAWGLGGADLVLIPEQFQMRDYMTPRGYKWDEEDTGSFMFNVSMEVRFPIYKWIGAAAFFDSGCVCDRFSDFDIQSMKSSVGLGLRLITPIGPLRLDYGYPVRGNGKRNYWPHVAFGYAF